MGFFDELGRKIDKRQADFFKHNGKKFSDEKLLEAYVNVSERNDTDCTRNAIKNELRRRGYRDRDLD